MPLAYLVARDYSRHCIGTAEADDIRSAALEGLVRAAQSFDIGRGATFATHARNMIGWSICGYRAGSHMLMGRGAMTHARKLGKAPPAVTSTSAIENFEERVAAGGSDAFDDAALAEQRQQLRAAIRQLPRRTADAVSMYYFEELTFAQLGKRLKLTRQRAQQIVEDGVAQVAELVRCPQPAEQEAALPIKWRVPNGQRAAMAWGPVDANGFSVHYLCNGTGKIGMRKIVRGTQQLNVRACEACSGKGHRRLAEPLASAV